MADIEKEVKEVFEEFDQKACVSLYRATINLTNGKKKAVKAALSNFGYPEEYRTRIARVQSSSLNTSYHWKEEPWLDANLPTSQAIVQLKSTLMAICGKDVKDFLECLTLEPKRVCFQWVEYWKVLMYIFPKQGYVNN